MDRGGFIHIGRILKSIGIKGEMIASLKPGVMNEENLPESVFVQIGHERVPFFFSDIQVHPDGSMVFMFDDCHNPDQARKFCGCDLFLPEAELPSGSGDIPAIKIIGYTVSDENRGMIGKVRDILEMPMQYLLQLESPVGEILIPYHPDIVLGADHRRKQLSIRAPEGLLEHYLDA